MMVSWVFDFLFEVLLTMKDSDKIFLHLMLKLNVKIRDKRRHVKISKWNKCGKIENNEKIEKLKMIISEFYTSC